MLDDFSNIPEYDQRIDPNTLDIFSPSDHWRSFDGISRSKQPAADPKPAVAATQPSSNLYCVACKKKFSNEATWQGHLKSAKHIANEKKGTPKTAGNMSVSKQPQDSAAKDCLNKLKQASTVAQSSNPAPAVGTLWSLSKSKRFLLTVLPNACII
ncbi:hypothetical protein BJV82DRAFT_213371 [Fennellomyces sp. T-0311]|nr:hypothetical protein BJV82DRAFT_213371 [Fennellomyces sp. T-0311]